jgi:hypothetical protein
LLGLVIAVAGGTMIEKMHLENQAVLPAKSFMEIQKRQLPK